MFGQSIASGIDADNNGYQGELNNFVYFSFLKEQRFIGDNSIMLLATLTEAKSVIKMISHLAFWEEGKKRGKAEAKQAVFMVI